MAGHPDCIDVTSLEVVAAGAPFGAAMKDVIRLGQPPGLELFDVLVTFEVDQVVVGGPPWVAAEFVSDPAGLNNPQNADVRAFAESLGPGVEVILNTPDQQIQLLTNGNPGGGPAGTSLYQVRIPNLDPDAIFVVGAAQHTGVYRIQCRVDFTFGAFFWTAYYTGDVVVRVSL